MSNLVSAKVHKKVFGSATRKSVMIYFADKASDGGEGIWASKTTIAAELEMHRATVIRTINELVAEGILIVVGDRRHRNGATVEYDISLEAVERLPEVELPRSEPAPREAGNASTRSAALPVAQRYPSHSATP
ncbi:helix-turn-helix domain-containing protein [Paracoccus sp. TOH]|uniref:helix-turn-helix domain-containing protein n=1 Tax=Paracoccus sp. TOH TaxID=1263728 RepID=UPI0025B2071D|nr:helix-turn-helix domain-containing protein [Paracoccus sp. TOH]WJS83556.1 helix-turn-helix domain-containing protein [Paracoccus sp. TOH]